MATSGTYIYNDLVGIKTPSFDWDGDDYPRQFRSFKRYAELILSTDAYSGKKGEEVVRHILLWMGPEAVDIFDHLPNLYDDKKTEPAEVWKAFQTYFEPKTNFRLARFQLFDMSQSTNESIDKFVTRIKVQAQKCNYQSIERMEDHIIDQIIKGIRHTAVRKKILDQDPLELTLDKAINFVRTYEATESQMQQFEDSHKCSINVVARKGQPTCHKDKSTFKTCSYCGGNLHSREECPAKESACNKCKKIGHWGKVCRNSAQHRPRTNQRQKFYHKRKYEPMRTVHSVDVDPEDFEKLTFHSVHKVQCNVKQKSITATIKIEYLPGCHTNLKGKVDTGAEGNILPYRVFKEIFKDSVLQKSNLKMFAYDGTLLQTKGYIDLPCKWCNATCESVRFYVAEVSGPILFGSELCQELGIVSVNCSVTTTTKPIISLDSVKDMYPDRFEGIGKFPKPQKLTLVKEVEPVRHPPRRAPIQLRQKIKAELDRMVKMDVIKAVQEPTDWVSSITYVRKQDGSLRICLDPKDLNLALKRGQHYTPTLEELTHRFKNANIFSKLDAKSGYWSVVLDPQSQLYTTFNSPFGRYCFKRLPFGLKISQDVFQAAMDDILDGLEGVVSIHDDIVIFGSDETEHDQRLHALMQRAREKGLVFNHQKCRIKTDEVTFFGNIYSRKGVRPDPMKVQAIVDLQSPQNVTELQSFLGMVTYLAPYIPNISEKSTALRQLWRKDAIFQWHHEHETAFINLKRSIQEVNGLQYFDPAKPAILQVDASQNALGAALTQGGVPIAFASKSLTDTEQRYANIERELLACVFGAERFHTYLYAKPFVIESDHKPLEMIARKTLFAAPPRLQRMLLRLQRYDYEINYRPGREMVLADSLSRLPKIGSDLAIDLDLQVCFVQFSTPRIYEIQVETQKDPELYLLAEYIKTGFPEVQNDLPKQIRQFWSFRDQLSIEDGIILKGYQVIIPSSLRDDYLAFIKDIWASADVSSQLSLQFIGQTLTRTLN
ncbi:Uncharacterised protein r2_g3487 [Pycnogonum litorale]